MTVELTPSEAALLLELLTKITVPAADPSSVQTCATVLSILKKLGEANGPVKSNV